MNRVLRVVCLAASLVLTASAWGAVPQLINFQGVLNTPGGTPVSDGNYSLTFAIYDAEAGGTMLWSESQSVTTSGGVFSVLLGSSNPIPDSAFADSVRFLGITVAPDAEMAPRQKLSSVAYAQRVGSLMGASGGLTVEIGDPGDTSFVSLLDEGTPAVDMACIPPPPVVGPCPPWTVATVGNPWNPFGQRAGMLRVLDCFGGQAFRVNGWNGDVLARGKATFGWGQINAGFYSFTAGAYNTITANTKMPTIPGGFCNVASADYATVGGGTNNVSSGVTATVGGGQGNQATSQGATVAGGDLNVSTAFFSTVGGGHNNFSTVDFATVAGGEINRANNFHASVGGGQNNGAAGMISTVAGGMNNMASDTGTAVGGGLNNQAIAPFATVGGGQGNTASGGWSVVSGGDGNQATGTYACVPGGSRNIASGSGSLASGSGAMATHDCSFVWADCCVDALGLQMPFLSQNINSFNARATGGFYLSTSCDPPGVGITTGVSVPPGGAAWVSLSDSTAKHNVRPVNGSEILEHLSRLPIHRWSYKSQGDGIDHIGPMAQDFYRLFRLGEDDKHISTLDPDGIALAAAKELYARTQSQQAEIVALKSQLARQSDELGALRAQLAGLEAAVQAVLAASNAQGDLKLSAVTDASTQGR